MYKDDWPPSVGDEFELEKEELNRHDRYSVAIKVSCDIVGHVPREFSKLSTTSLSSTLSKLELHVNLILQTNNWRDT